MSIKKLFVLGVVITLGLVGCSKRTLVRNYYVLDAPQDDRFKVLDIETPIPVSVDVRDFDVSNAFDDTRIVSRSGSHEIRYYYYHHWAVRPSAAIAELIFQELDALQLFQTLALGFEANVGYIVSGKLFALERQTRPDAMDACHVHLVFELQDERSGHTVVRHEYERTEPLSDTSMNTFAVQISDLILRGHDAFLEKVIASFKSHPPRTSSS